MKSTGIVRKIDNLGRIVLPAELRSALDIRHNTPIEIYTDYYCVILKKQHNEAGILESTKIVRKVDNLGRIVLPVELRSALDFQNESPIEIFTDDNCIILKKYQPSCIFCGEARDVIEFEGKIICSACLKKLKELEK